MFGWKVILQIKGTQETEVDEVWTYAQAKATADDLLKEMREKFPHAKSKISVLVRYKNKDNWVR